MKIFIVHLTSKKCNLKKTKSVTLFFNVLILSILTSANFTHKNGIFTTFG
jgi:hypothetical protein